MVWFHTGYHTGGSLIKSQQRWHVLQHEGPLRISLKYEMPPPERTPHLSLQPRERAHAFPPTHFHFISFH